MPKVTITFTNLIYEAQLMLWTCKGLMVVSQLLLIYFTNFKLKFYYKILQILNVKFYYKITQQNNKYLSAL